ncbi:MAG: DUF1842 domain-containing protein [Opitutae bacterium]|nr:DUF1842 domain-containing protein [Opitutae bacterium]
MSEETSSATVATPATFYTGQAGNPLPGGAILRFWLVQGPNTSVVSGHAETSQAIAPPNGHVVYPHVSGHVYTTGFGPAKLLINFSGETVISLPPPAIGSWLSRLAANCVVDRKTGKGMCHWTVNNVQHQAPVVVKIVQA